MTVKKYGIIGCGMMGQEHIKNIALLKDAVITALHDPDATQIALAKKLVPGAKVYSSVDHMMADDGLDALIIASPNHTHVPLLTALAQHKPIPILCEKPLLIPGQEAALMAFQARYKAPLWVAMEYRYMPAIAAFRKRVEAATGGIKMLTIREHRFPFLDKIGAWNRFNANTGGTLIEKCCHFFDLMRLLINSDPIRITASAGLVGNHQTESYGGNVPDIWDSAFVLVDFASGVRACLDLCMFADGSRWQEEISAVGLDGKIDCRIPGPPRFWPDHLGPQPEAELEIAPRAPIGPTIDKVAVPDDIAAAGDHHGSTFYQHQRFLDVVKGTAQPDVTIEDGFKAVMMGAVAEKAAQEGRSLSVDFGPAFGTKPPFQTQSYLH